MKGVCAAIFIISILFGNAAAGLWAWNAKAARLDPNSKNLIAKFAPEVKSHLPNLNVGQWSVPVVEAHEGDPMYHVSTQHSNCLDDKIRIPIGTKPEQSSDGSLVIIDTVTGREHNMFRTKYDSQTRRITSAEQGYSLNHGANGPAGANAAGFAMSQGLITCDMFLKGHPHYDDLGINVR